MVDGRVWVSTIVLICVVACAREHANALSGDFVAVSAGHPPETLPWDLEFNDVPGCTTTLLSARYDFQSDGWTSLDSMRTRCVGRQDSLEVVRDRGEFTVHGDTVSLFQRDGQEARRLLDRLLWRADTIWTGHPISHGSPILYQRGHD